MFLNPLNVELNPICHLLALFGAHHILHVSRIRVNDIYFYDSSMVLTVIKRQNAKRKIGNLYTYTA